MMRRAYDVCLQVEVFDEDALFAAALTHAMAVDGMGEKEATELLKPDVEIDVEACLVMLLDPGVSPGGMTIEETTIERY